MTSATPIVSVVLATFNRVDVLRRVLRAYEAQRDAPPFEVVVMDDGSTDGTWEHLSKLTPRRYRLIVDRQENAGPARARNRALTRASGEIVLFTGDDIVPGTDFVGGHAAAQHLNGAIVIGQTVWHPDFPVSSVMRHIDGIGGQQFLFWWLRDGQQLGFKFFYTSNASLPRRRLDGIEGPFDQEFTGAAFEDSDLAYRLMGRRREIVYRSGLTAYHVHEHTVRSFADRQRRAGRMAALFFRKHPEVQDEFRRGEVDEEARRAAGTDDSDTVQTMLDAAEAALLAVLDRHRDCFEPWLDPIYLGFFRYCYERGLLEAQGGAAIARSLLLARQLGGPMQWAWGHLKVTSAPEEIKALATLACLWRDGHHGMGRVTPSFGRTSMAFRRLIYVLRRKSEASKAAPADRAPSAVD